MSNRFMRALSAAQDAWNRNAPADAAAKTAAVKGTEAKSLPTLVDHDIRSYYLYAFGEIRDILSPFEQGEDYEIAACARKVTLGAYRHVILHATDEVLCHEAGNASAVLQSAIQWNSLDPFENQILERAIPVARRVEKMAQAAKKSNLRSLPIQAPI